MQYSCTVFFEISNQRVTFVCIAGLADAVFEAKASAVEEKTRWMHEQLQPPAELAQRRLRLSPERYGQVLFASVDRKQLVCCPPSSYLKCSILNGGPMR